MNRLKNKKGVVSVSYAALMVFGVAGLVAISQYYDRIIPLCSDGPLDPICSGDLIGGNDANLDEGGSAEDEIVIGDDDYDPDPSTPMAGPWVFGAGQVYNRHAPSNVTHSTGYTVRNYDYTHPDNKSVLATGFLTGYQDDAGDWVQDPSGGGTQNNEWFDETRSLELDESIDCSLARLEERYGGYCLAHVDLEARSVQSGFDKLSWTGGDPYTIDYGEFAFDSVGESVVLDLSFEDIETDLFGRQPYEVEKQLRIYMDSDENSIHLTNMDNVFLEVEGRGNQTTIEVGEESTLALGDGLFETNNGSSNKQWYSSYYDINHTLEHRYLPTPGGVVAAYPYVLGYDHLDSFSEVYDTYKQKYDRDQHRVDLTLVDGWAIKECVVEEVPFIRELEPEATQSNSNYDSLRERIGATGPRKGATVVMENDQGETWKLIHVDRPAFSSEECSLDNTDLFIR